MSRTKLCVTDFRKSRASEARMLVFADIGRFFEIPVLSKGIYFVTCINENGDLRLINLHTGNRYWDQAELPAGAVMLEHVELRVHDADHETNLYPTGGSFDGSRNG